MGEFQFTDLLDNFLSLPLLIVLNQIVSKGPAIVRRAKEASLAVKGARLFNLLPGTIQNINWSNYTLRHYAAKHNALMDKMPRWKIWPGRPYAQCPRRHYTPDSQCPRWHFALRTYAPRHYTQDNMPRDKYAPRHYAPCQTGSNRVKQGQTGSNGVKQGQTG